MLLKAVSNRETEVVVEDEQVFLTRMQQTLLSGGSATTRIGESPMRTTPMGMKAAPRMSVGGIAGVQGSPKKVHL